MSEAIEFVGLVFKVQTLVDNTIRVWFDLNENQIYQAAQLMECQRVGKELKVQCQADDGRKQSKRRRTADE